VELGVHRFTWLLFVCQRTFVIDVLAHFSVIDVVALNNKKLLLDGSDDLTEPLAEIFAGGIPEFEMNCDKKVSLLFLVHRSSDRRRTGVPKKAPHPGQGKRGAKLQRI